MNKPMPGKVFLRHLFIYILLLALSVNSFGQKAGTKIFYPGSYLLDLPETWLKPKTLRLLTDILPATLDELKNRNFRTSGKADYTVRLYIDSLEFTNAQSSLPLETSTDVFTHFRYTYSFNYRFYAALIVLDTFQKPVTALRLVSGEEDFTYSREYNTRGTDAAYELNYTYDTSGRVTGSYVRQIASPTVPMPPQRNPGEYVNEETLVRICENRLKEISKILAKYED